MNICELIVKSEDRNNPDYKCTICKSFLMPKTTVQIDCSHLFCHSCIYSNINISGNKKCPLCQKIFYKYEFIKHVNKFAYNILSDVEIKCPNEGCNDILTMGNIDYHLKKCDYKLIDCPYCDKKNIIRKELKKHLTENIKDHFLNLVETVEELKKRLK